MHRNLRETVKDESWSSKPVAGVVDSTAADVRVKKKTTWHATIEKVRSEPRERLTKYSVASRGETFRPPAGRFAVAIFEIKGPLPAAGARIRRVGSPHNARGAMPRLAYGQEGPTERNSGPVSSFLGDIVTGRGADEATDPLSLTEGSYQKHSISFETYEICLQNIFDITFVPRIIRDIESL